jgi:hypothetical protein
MYFGLKFDPPSPAQGHCLWTLLAASPETPFSSHRGSDATVMAKFWLQACNMSPGTWNNSASNKAGSEAEEKLFLHQAILHEAIAQVEAMCRSSWGYVSLKLRLCVRRRFSRLILSRQCGARYVSHRWRHDMPGNSIKLAINMRDCETTAIFRSHCLAAQLQRIFHCPLVHRTVHGMTII